MYEKIYDKTPSNEGKHYSLIKYELINEINIIQWKNFKSVKYFSDTGFYTCHF